MSYQIHRLNKGNGKSNWIQVVTDSDIDGEGAVYSTAADQDLVENMQRWCKETNCGVRMSYDQFAFKNEKELFTFLLKWDK